MGNLLPSWLSQQMARDSARNDYDDFEFRKLTESFDIKRKVQVAKVDLNPFWLPQNTNGVWKII